MRALSTVIIVALVALSLAAVASAATPAAKPAPAKVAPVTYDVTGKIVKTGKGWIDVEITKVGSGTGLKTGAMLRVTRGSKTRVLESGKAVSASRLAVGETVEVRGAIVKGAKSTSYTAASVNIVK
jgi:hypothetical protein